MYLKKLKEIKQRKFLSKPGKDERMVVRLRRQKLKYTKIGFFFKRWEDAKLFWNVFIKIGEEDTKNPNTNPLSNFYNSKRPIHANSGYIYDILMFLAAH